MIEEIRPKLRGALHLLMVPLVIVGAIFLLLSTKKFVEVIACAAYLLTSLLLFAGSSTFHFRRDYWAEKLVHFLWKFDHSSIYLIIAGSTTPVAVAFLRGWNLIVLISIIWTIAIAGIVQSFLWIQAPRWLSVIFYLGMGCIPLIWLVPLISGFSKLGSIGILAMGFIGLGGVFYALGAVIYARRPTWACLKSGWFEFHEVFHGFTVIAYCLQFGAIYMIVS